MEIAPVCARRHVTRCVLVSGPEKVFIASRDHIPGPVPPAAGHQHGQGIRMSYIPLTHSQGWPGTQGLRQGRPCWAHRRPYCLERGLGVQSLNCLTHTHLKYEGGQYETFIKCLISV